MRMAFPILLDLTERRDASIPRSVSWDVVLPHSERALENHDQTLERLAQRGGLSPQELWCVVHGRPLREFRHGMSQLHGSGPSQSR